MSEMSRSARRALRAKAHRIAKGQEGPVDCSSYGGEENMHADVRTGMRPISRRAYKAGGKVDGDDAPKNAGKMARASGGKALVTDLVNRDDKVANEAREGEKHTGGLKTGGRAAKASGGNAGDEVPQTMFNLQPTQSRMVKAAGLKAGGTPPKPKPTDDGWDDPDGGAPLPPPPKAAGGCAVGSENSKGGRTAKAGGGAAEAMYSGRSNEGHKRSSGKDKTNINIVIATGPRTPQPEGPMPPLPGGPGGLPPMGGAPSGPPMMAAPSAGAPPPMGAPTGGAPVPLGRKTGGRAYRSYKDMDAGARGGLGRLEKTEIAKRKK